MGTIVNLEVKPKPYVSPYLRLEPRTEAEVLSLLEARQKRLPKVELPCDTGGAA